MLRRFSLVVAILAVTCPRAFGAFINTNDINVYNAFATGATFEDFESVGTLTPLALTSYANATNSSTTVPAGAQLSTQLTGSLFHSGGGSFNNPVGNPGTPAALLQLQGGISGDAHSGSNVVGSLEINSTLLDLDQFVEFGLTDGTRVNRIGVWVNPSLGPVLFTAFDENLTPLESGTGSPGNFVGVLLPTDTIRSISIISTSASGFTIDDLTYGKAAAVPEPTSAVLILIGTGLVAICRRRG
jgi:hypothetical protein